MGFEEFVAAVIREIHDLGMTVSVEEQNSLFKKVNHRLLHSNLKTAKTRKQILGEPMARKCSFSSASDYKVIFSVCNVSSPK